MTDGDPILGDYTGEGVGLTLVREGGEILLVFPDAPAGHEPRPTSRRTPSCSG